MKSYFGYVRVSTVKQGEFGSSLIEQRAAIDSYARQHNLKIAGWFEEMETAAKQGRRAFTKMLQELERRRAAGVIIHKIDRGARNLKDWAHLGELIDRGIEVHFVHDNLDLSTRGGRLSADIQAVVAADFIRNLRDEVRKGLWGRLRQGIYPFKAPYGYLDCGGGKLKQIDPVTGPLVKQAFDLYASGNYGLHQLRFEMAKRGLASRPGKPLSLNGMSKVLRNPFYWGLIRIERTGETFEGAHEPLITRALFDRVQAILDGKLYPRIEIHEFLFRRLIKCSACGRSLTGERQKGHVYYRCHSIGCQAVSVREDGVDGLVRAELSHLRVADGDIREFREVIAEGIARDRDYSKAHQQRVARDLTLADERLERLTDALLEGLIDKETYDERKERLLAQRLELRAKSGTDLTTWKTIAEWFELGLTALHLYETRLAAEKRDILKSVGSNLIAHGKNVEFPLLFPFAEFRKWSIENGCEDARDTVRTATRDTRPDLLLRTLNDVHRATLAREGSKTHTARNAQEAKASCGGRTAGPLLSRPVTQGTRNSARADA